MSSHGTLRVAIVDDHPMIRLGLAAAIGEMNGIDLVGEAQRADEVAAMVTQTAPDVVLLDVRLPDGSGLEVNRWLAERHPDVKVLMLTMSEDLDTMMIALREVARGYLVKGAGPERIELALRSVAAGDVVVERSLAAAVVDATPFRRATPRPFPQLTPREFEVLELIAGGHDNTTIARRLVLNQKTVRNHVSNVFAKIHASDRAHAVVLVHRMGVGC